MALILNIDSSTEQASISVAENGQSLCLLTNADQKDHSSWIHIAIQQALQTVGKTTGDLDAVAITAGPGSYTGLRVGMATAKGLCYALELPFITVNTLEAMAAAVSRSETLQPTYICPMIDARRMEVFTALYDAEGREIIPPCAMILETDSFSTYLDTGKVLFFGNGSGKWKEMLDRSETLQPIAHPQNVLFQQIPFTAATLAGLSYKKYEKADFSTIAYTEPLYVKDFYTPITK